MIIPESTFASDHAPAQDAMSNQSQAEIEAWNDWQDALRAVDAAHERARRAEAAYLAAVDRSARAPSLTKASPEPSAPQDSEASYWRAVAAAERAQLEHD